MSGRRAPDRNRIRGPQSALTDFLAANNISARQIRDTYEERNRNAQVQTSAEASANPTSATADEDVESDGDEGQSRAESSKKRKRAKEKVKSKGKPIAKKRQNIKGKKVAEDDEGSNPSEASDSDAYGNALGRAMYKKSKPSAGQLENCEICEKRFTVTAYSKTGPEGGLVCSPCGRDLAKDEDNTTKKPKKPAPGKARRKVESNRLDGASGGTKSLEQLCIEQVANYNHAIDELGDLQDHVLIRLSAIFSKRRVLDQRTVALFLRPDLDTVAIYDCARLEVEDFQKIFAVVPKVKKLVLRNACQFKDAVMEYMLERASDLSHFDVYAANLITNKMWKKFFERHGRKLQVLRLAWLDASFDDDVVAVLVKNCPNLTRLKLKHCSKITSASLPLIANLKNLAHLSLQLSHSAEPEDLVSLISSLGQNLKTLSLENCPEADDSVADAIRTRCGKLMKLRLTDTTDVTDKSLKSLLTQIPPLTFLDLSNVRDVDNNNPDGPADIPIGLSSNSFKALMANHGTQIQRLHIASCRHISNSAFWDVFIDNRASSAARDDNETLYTFPSTYSQLEELNVSFCSGVDTSIIKGIFRSCPRLKKLVAFGCFNVGSVIVPNGVVLIGVPRVQDALEQNGSIMGVEDVFEALEGMTPAIEAAG